MIWWLILAGLTLGVWIERERPPPPVDWIEFIEPPNHGHVDFNAFIAEMHSAIAKQLRPRRDLWR